MPFLLFLSDKSSPASVREEAAAGKGESKRAGVPTRGVDDMALKEPFYGASATDLTLEPACGAI
jgi:hypothetical protein